MGFNYTGKPLTDKGVTEFLERTRMRAKATFDYNKSSGKFVKRESK